MSDSTVPAASLADHVHAAGWYDVFAFLRDRRRILRDPTCTLAPAGVLALSPATFARFAFLVLPLAMLAAVAGVARWVADPPESAAAQTHAQITAMKEDLQADLRTPRGDPPVAITDAYFDATRPAFVMVSLTTTMPVPVDPAIRTQALRTLADEYRRIAAPLQPPQRAWLARAADYMYMIQLWQLEFTLRWVESGAAGLATAGVIGLTILLLGRAFRRLIRRHRSRFVHADAADRVFLYYVSARLLPMIVLTVASMAVGSIGAMYQIPVAHGFAYAGGLIGLATCVVYYRCGRPIASVLIGEPATAADGHFISNRLLAMYGLQQAFGAMCYVVLLSMPMAYAFWRVFQLMD